LNWKLFSGEFFIPLEESVPHQIISSSPIITCLVRGLLGLKGTEVINQEKLKKKLKLNFGKEKIIIQEKKFRLNLKGSIFFSVIRDKVVTTRGMRFEGTLVLSQRAKAARFRLRSSSLQSETVPAQPSYDLLHRIPLACPSLT